MAFPASPSNNQVHKETNGHTYVYDSALGTWDRVSDVTAIEHLNKTHAYVAANMPVLNHRYLRTQGGSQTVYDTFKVHTFYHSDLFVVHDQITAEVLMVGPGGAGGSPTEISYGVGGGGGGAVVHRTALVIPPGIYPIEIGRGGNITTATKNANSHTEYRGMATRGFGVTAIPGGSGNLTSGASPLTGANSGGGGYSGAVIPAVLTAITGWSVYGGFVGGQGKNGMNHGGGGGGGANQAGETPTNNLSNGGYGGDGKIIAGMGPFGESFYWGAGGGGSTVRWDSGCPRDRSGGDGGQGGGGGGSSTSGMGGWSGKEGISPGQAGLGRTRYPENENGGYGGGDAGANTGSGGGGTGGRGADGIVIIKFTV